MTDNLWAKKELSSVQPREMLSATKRTCAIAAGARRAVGAVADKARCFFPAHFKMPASSLCVRVAHARDGAEEANNLDEFQVHGLNPRKFGMPP